MLGGFDPDAVRRGARVGDGARRHAGAGRRRAGAGTRRATAPHRSSLYAYGAYEASMRALVLGRPAVAARPRRGVGPRPPARRRRARPALVPRRQAAAEAQHVHRRRSPPPSTSSPSGVRRRRPGDAPGRQRRRAARRARASTMRPDLFAGAVANVPFVDVVTTMSDPSLPLTVTEWDEWGDPRDEPYASVHARATRPTTTSRPRRVPGALRDRRAQRPTRQLPRAGEVGGEAAGHRLRRASPLLLRTQMGAGHGGPSRSLRHVARRGPGCITFLLRASRRAK